MKVIRAAIKPVSVCTEGDDNNNEFTLEVLDSEPGYYEHVIRPMLKKGHEGELIGWLKDNGLLRQYQKCRNAGTNENCKKPLAWYSSRTMDNYQWKCLNCAKKYSIRENSVFNDFRCPFPDAIRIILGWCKGKDSELMANILGVRKQVVNYINRKCAETAKQYIDRHIPQWQVGGPNVIVIIDTYPEGCKKFDPEHYSEMGRNIVPVICIAEAKEIPPRYYFQILDKSLNTEELQNKFALNLIQKIVKPGSTLVANLNSKVCSYQTLQSLKHFYPVIVSVDGLERHNNADQNILRNLGTIWKPALEVCEFAQCNLSSEVQNYLTNYMWMQRFGNQSFEVLLNQMSCSEN